MLDAKTLYIDGAWRASSSGATFTVTDPSDGSALATAADGTAEDASAAIAAAGAAQPAWGATSIAHRAQVLRGLHAAVIAHTEELAELIAAESGKPVSEAIGEIGYGAQFISWFADQATQAFHGEHYTDPAGTTRILTSRRPVGPCLLITPWNFPLAMVTRKLAPALAAGCTSVLKPAEQTPLTAIRLIELLNEQDVPPGVVNVVTTTQAREVSAAVFASPALRKVSFTGSTAIGGELLRNSSHRVVSTSMELGGNAPFLVFDDAAPDVVDGAIVAKLRNGGQSCIAANRFLVHDIVADEFTEKLVGAFSRMRVGTGRAVGTDVGPLIDSRAVEKVSAMVEQAVDAGARVAYRAEVPAGQGSFYPPTVLIDAPLNSPVYRDEVFGPVATVTRFTDEHHAVELANDTQAGLAAYVFSADLSRALRVAAALDFGIVGVNRGFVSTAAAPFGGTKTSGLGREGGLHGLEEYLETQYLSLPVDSPIV